MKTTDFAMIFVAIILPIIIVVYVDVSFLLEREEQKLYYINIINSAIDDATYAMKSVEGEDVDLDYGYTGIATKKVAVNANIAVETFFNSLYNNFEINGDKVSEEYLKTHVPAMAILDYNGVYIYSIESYETIVKDKNGNNEAQIYANHVLKPKRFFSYTYGVSSSGELLSQEELSKETSIVGIDLYSVIFTMDDYIYFINNDGTKTGFYMEDSKNNELLYADHEELKEEIIRHLKTQRSLIIAKIVSDEMSYAVNEHNNYSDIDYNFYFPQFAVSDWEQLVDNIGIVAFVQGISIGNDKLDYTAHGVSALKVTDRYYVSKSKTDELDYYHVTKDCPIYKNQHKVSAGYYLSQIDASALGYYPCPTCNP